MNLIDRIDNYLVTKESRKRERHYASDVSACKRQLFYKWKDKTKSNPISPGALWKMSSGNKLHDMIAEFLKETGLEIVSEISGRKKIKGLKYEFGYRIDNLFFDPEAKDLAGIEIKTSYGRGVKAIQKSGMPKKNDLKQVIVYMEMEDISTFYLFYFGRDNGYRTQFKVTMGKDGYLVDGKPVDYDFADILERLAAVEIALDQDKLPDRDYMVAIKNGEIKDKFQKDKVEYKSSWQCRYCGWQNDCWKDEIKKYEKGDNADDIK